MRCVLVSVIALAAAVTAHELTITVPFDPGSVRFSRLGAFDEVLIPGLPVTATPGAPCLPRMPVRVALPTGCVARSVEVVGADYLTMPGRFHIPPASHPLPLSQPVMETQTPPDPEIYGLDRAYPYNEAVLTSSSVLWGIPIAYVTVNPVRWNPADLTLQVLEQLTLRVLYEEDPSVNLITRRTGASEAMAMEVATKLVINPEMVSPSGATIVEPRDLEYGQYVIIAHPDLLPQAQELADWKTAKGIPASVYTTDWIQSMYPGSDLQQEMRAFLAECREEGTDYVLILGDNDMVQCRQSNLVAWQTFPGASDLYFADINDTLAGTDLWDANGNGVWGEVPYPCQYPQPEGYDQVDYHPDLWVGRASVSTVSEAEIFVDKVFIYEGIARCDYFETAPRELRIGYTTGILWYSPFFAGSFTAESISTLLPSAQWEEEKLYEINGTNSGANTIAMINSMPHHVYHASHGTYDEMWTCQGSGYSVADIMAQTNIQSGGLPALWQSMACDIGAMDYGAGDCCADAWLASPGGGGFGCFNSRIGWGPAVGTTWCGPSSSLCIRFYQDHWVNDIYTYGIAHGASMDYFCPPQGEDGFDFCVKEYNLFGDPELPIWTAVPTELTVVHPSVINQAGTVTVTVTQGGAPVPNARVCLQKGDWQTGEVYEVAFTNGSGVAELFITPETPGSIAVVVWARNHFSYQAAMTFDPLAIEVQTPSAGMEPATPNPAASSVTLGYSLAQPGHVSIEVFDLAGRRVVLLVNDTIAAGSHALQWNLRDSGNRPVPAGFYVARFTGGGTTATTRFMVVR